LILRFPLPAILSALVLDAADQTIFQNNTDLDLTNYQGYDKALDIYYLSIAYLSTFRNWADPFAARTAQVLWYYRLLGVVLFELTQARALLIVFPNTFEYFFIAYEAVRLAWNPARLSHRQVLGLAAFIWIFIKLPQEWWLHVAKLDFTDFMKEDVFGVTVETSWADAIGENLWFLVVVAGAAIGIAVAVRAAVRAAPPPDFAFGIDVDTRAESTRIHAEPTAPVLFSWDLLEKVLLTSMIAIIFAKVLPGSEATPLQITFAVGFLVVANSAVSQWLTLRGHSWRSTFGQFVAMVIINIGIAGVYIALLRRSDEPVNERAALFFILLLTLIVTLFDRLRPVRVSGFGQAGQPPASAQPRAATS
ncbi:MAG: hypothetical protein OEW83_20155, partial [Acidimicrobiia bacterium]|nr:hypothetical protein [Acidimicrobiia bacterium]